MQWVRILVGIAFVGAGLTKFVNPESQKAFFEPYPAFMMPLIGALEMAGGLALLANKLARWAALGLAVIMAGAVFTQIRIGGGPQAVPAAVLLVLNLLIFSKTPPDTGKRASAG